MVTFFAQYCPLKNISGDYPPTVLLHSDQNTDVPYEQSVSMAQELVNKKVIHELIILPQQGHCFDNDIDNSLVKEIFGKMLEFLNTQINGNICHVH